MSEITQVTHGRMGNTKPSSRARRWCFTWNNYTNEDVDALVEWFTQKGHIYTLGFEVGEECKTPHIQGYFECKNGVMFSTITKKFPKIHLEKCKGTKKQNIEYCTKSGQFITNAPPERRVRALMKYSDVKWLPWQADVLSILEGPVDPRKVHWYWEDKGNCGKSFLAKYLVLQYDAIICTGKSADVFNQVNVWLEKNPDKDPKVVLLDVPRSAQDYINYGALEQLKNGLLYSGKYEGGVCVFDSPHVICFANVPPDERKMSEDRWDIVYIN